jgi:hypothetical protein
MYLSGDGSLGIGTTSLTGMSLRLGKTITGATTSYGVLQQGIVQSDVTSTAYGYYNEINTAASTFTLTNYRHFFAAQSTIGAGSTVTNQVGFYVSSNMTSGTNNFAFRGDIPSGTNRWNLYMNGTAANYMAGQLLIGTTTTSAFALDVTGSLNSSLEGFLPPNSEVAYRIIWSYKDNNENLVAGAPSSRLVISNSSTSNANDL